MHAMGEGTERLSVARRLWSPPARFADRPTERRVTFLELFFDLVFVVVIGHHPVTAAVRAGLATGVRGASGVGTAAWGEALAAAALDLLADPVRRGELSRRGRLAIDGQGTARVARAIAALRSAARTRQQARTS